MKQEKTTLRSSTRKAKHNRFLVTDENIVLLTDLEGLHQLNLDDITHICCNDSYCTFHLLNATKKTITSSLKYVLEQLQTLGFLQIHQSRIVNLKNVQSFKRNEKGERVVVTKQTNCELVVAESHIKDVIAALRRTK